MNVSNFGMTTLQMAIALNCIFHTPVYGRNNQQTNKNQMVVVPAAKGKSRIAMAIAIGVQFKYPQLDKIYVVYLNKVLMDQDQENWDKLTLRVPIHRVIGIEATKESGFKTAIIVDEADAVFIDQLKECPKKCRLLIGLTATLPKEDGLEGGFIKNRLKHQRWDMVIKHEEHAFKPKPPHQTTPIASVEEFFQKSIRNAKLIFATEDQHDKIKQLA